MDLALDLVLALVDSHLQNNQNQVEEVLAVLEVTTHHLVALVEDRNLHHRHHLLPTTMAEYVLFKVFNQ